MSLAKSARMGLGIQNRAAGIKILAEQRAGKLLAQVERSRGGYKSTTPASLAIVYAENEIAPRTGERWQAMAAVPEETVRELENTLTADRTDKSQIISVFDWVPPTRRRCLRCDH